jgi:hypothetical protein
MGSLSNRYLEFLHSQCRRLPPTSWTACTLLRTANPSLSPHPIYAAMELYQAAPRRRGSGSGTEGGGGRNAGAAAEGGELYQAPRGRGAGGGVGGRGAPRGERGVGVEGLELY